MFARAPENDAANRIVAVELADDDTKQSPHVFGKSVELVWAVEDNRNNATFALDENWLAHGSIH